MGLSLKARKEIQKEHYKRYQKASKKGKGEILDKLAEATGHNRDYLAWILTSYGKTKYVTIEGERVKLVAGSAGHKRKRKGGGGRPRRYHDSFIKSLTKIWAFFDGQCGTRLVPLIRSAIDFLEASGEPDFGITSGIRRLLLEISGSHADRLLRPAKKKLELRGKNLTKGGPLLKNQIPVRTFFKWDERKPGFFEIDRVAHCGYSTSGHFCWTLTATDIYSGWTEERALLNNANRWTKEALIDIRGNLPFALYGLDSDNGGEFINQQLYQWCQDEGIQFTRGRPYRKNDNCFVEQKNGDRVRKTVGYHRYDTGAELEALNEVYRYLNLFTNYWQPSIKISGKTKLENGKYKKKYEAARAPCQRLLESEDIPEGVKRKIRRELKKQNPVELKKSLDNAVDRLIKLNEQKNAESKTASKLAEEAAVGG
jgi:hypothetical protein